MIFSSLAAQLVALAIVGSSLASPAPFWKTRANQILIGWRSVSAAEATSINKVQTLVYDKAKATGGKQNGDGVYLTAGFGEWPSSGTGVQICRVMADGDKVQSANKAWIPEIVEWTEAAVAKAIKIYNTSWNPDKVLRLSMATGTTIRQLIIPSGLVGKSGFLFFTHQTTGDLEIAAECRLEAAWATNERSTADWTSTTSPFTHNVRGTVQ